MKKSRIVSLAGGLVGTAALAVVAIATAPAASADQALKGSAFGVKVKLDVANTEVAKVDPLPFVSYPDGGDDAVVKLDSREIADRSEGVVTAKVIRAASQANQGTLTSRASVLDLAVGLQNPPESADEFEGATLLTASVVTAKCTAGPDGVKGESSLADVFVGGIAKGDGQKLVEGSGNGKVAVKPNTTIPVEGLGKVVLNEQIKTKSGITVNAIHVYLDPELKLLYGDIIVSQAVCSAGEGTTPTSGPSSPAASPSASTSPGEPTTPAPSASTEPGGGGGGDLPTTGFKLLTFASIGAGLVAVGMAVLWFMRRRNQEAPETS